MSKVIISNGFSKFHLAVAAVEAHQRGLLSLFITGAYPTPLVRLLTTGTAAIRGHKVGRLLARGEAIPDTEVRPLWLSETLQQTAQFFHRLPPLAGMGEWLSNISLRLYARQAVNRVRRASGDTRLYHYRAGFGHESVREAKAQGMVALCDHSIAHPAVLEYLVANKGRLPPTGERGAMSRRWVDILADIEQADAILVNSDFVKDTFVHQGWDPACVHVIYLGVDDQFIDAVPHDSWRGCNKTGPVRLMFAGALVRRKGAAELLSAVAEIGEVPWRIEIVGAVADEIKRDFAEALLDSRIELAGTVPRAELATRMANAEVFIFPSLAEGSARVVFEALAAGCYVITTPNTGSIVEDGIHGALVAPGDVDALAGAIRRAISDRDAVARVGRRNADLIRRSYRQTQYGEALERLYARLLAERRNRVSAS